MKDLFTYRLLFIGIGSFYAIPPRTRTLSLVPQESHLGHARCPSQVMELLGLHKLQSTMLRLQLLGHEVVWGEGMDPI